MGVITLKTIDYGRIYGPLPKSSVVTDPVSHIGLLTNDKASQAIMLQVNLEDSTNVSPGLEWLCYIHPARTEDEQNMEAYIKDGQIYYRALMIIKAHEELFIWYSKDFAMLIGIPELQRGDNREMPNYVCPYCGESYDYPFPLRAHVRFKCPNRSIWSTADKLAKIPIESKTIKKSQGSPKITDNNNVHIEPFDMNKPSSRLSPNRIHSDFENRESAVKRKSTEMRDDCSPEKRIDIDRQPTDLSIKTTNDHAVDANQNFKISQRGMVSEEGHSAFRKVERLTPNSSNSFTQNPMRSPTSRVIVPMSSKAPSLTLPMAHTTLASPIRSMGVPVGSNGVYLDSRMPVFPMMSPFHQGIVGQLPRPNLFEAVQMNSIMACERASQLAKGKFEEKERDLKNIENNNPLGICPPKMGSFDKPNSYPVVRTINPMLEKMMHPPTPTMMHAPLSSVNVLQNCCAQCTATFRMTSDLVYHMRSHHKREFDPMKRKREDKLKCNICNETFRERHHLTRHMTSHL